MSKLGLVLEGKYEVTGLIGEGGMGAVYEAHHRFIGRKVAIKFLHAEFASNPQAIQRFLQEAQIAGSLGHENICEVTDIGRTDDGAPYMLMPLLAGCSLGQAMTEEKALLSTKRVFDIIHQVLTGLQRAHDAGIVHRDLKPDNIFLTRMGEREDFVKILDFGISKIVAGSMPGVSGGLTTTGMVLGTPYYMAPEQARGAKGIDHRVDIYALGVILYELLTGRPPFQAESYNEIIVKIVMEPFSTPRSLNPKIPPSVEDVVLKAMARDPAERYASVTEFSRALLTQARASEMKLPQYLTRAGFTGEMEVLDEDAPASAIEEGESALPRRNLLRPAIAVMALAVLAVVLVAWQPWKNGSEATSSARSRSEKSTSTADLNANKPVIIAEDGRVTLRFKGLPRGGVVTVDGRPAPLGEIELNRSDRRVRFRATAPGYETHEGWIVPDKNRMEQLRLAKVAAVEPAMKTKRRVRRRRAIKAVMKTVMGRSGTEIEDDYDQD